MSAPPPAPSSFAEIAATLAALRDELVAFARTRGAGQEADDLVHSVTVRALESVATLRDPARVRAWAYRALRNAIVDRARAMQRTERREVASIDVDQLAVFVEDAHVTCQCAPALAGTLNPAQAALLTRVDAGGESVASAAAALGITPNHASVQLYRGRRKLRDRLEAHCGMRSALDPCRCQCAAVSPSASISGDSGRA